MYHQKSNKNRANIILIIDDNPTDVLLMTEAFALCDGHNEIHTAEDGVYALEFVRKQNSFKQSPTPDIILLDLNMPRKNGLEVLMELKSDPKFSFIPIIVYTSSAAPEDVKAAYERHANAYVKKPGDFESYIKIAKSISDFWLSVAIFYSDSSV